MAVLEQKFCDTSFEESLILNHIEKTHTAYDTAIEKTKYCGVGYYHAICEDCGMEVYHPVKCKSRYCPECLQVYLKSKRRLLYKLMEKFRGKGRVTYSVFTVPKEAREYCRDKNRWKLVQRKVAALVKCFLSKKAIIVSHTWGDKNQWNPHFNVISFTRRYVQDNWRLIRHALKIYWNHILGIELDDVNFYEQTTIGWRESDKYFKQKAGHITKYVLRMPELTRETLVHYEMLDNKPIMQPIGWTHKEWGVIKDSLEDQLDCEECHGALRKISSWSPTEQNLRIWEKYPRGPFDDLNDEYVRLGLQGRCN